MDKTILILFTFLLFATFSEAIPDETFITKSDSGQTKIRTKSGIRTGQHCRDIWKYDEEVFGFNADGYYVEGKIKSIDKNYLEGCVFDDNGKEDWFAGEWVSTCYLTAHDEKGGFLDLVTDDCWDERNLHW